LSKDVVFHSAMYLPGDHSPFPYPEELFGSSSPYQGKCRIQLCLQSLLPFLSVQVAFVYGHLLGIVRMTPAVLEVELIIVEIDMLQTNLGRRPFHFLIQLYQVYPRLWFARAVSGP
jgi:hypothetical protein